MAALALVASFIEELPAHRSVACPRCAGRVRVATSSAPKLNSDGVRFPTRPGRENGNEKKDGNGEIGRTTGKNCAKRSGNTCSEGREQDEKSGIREDGPSGIAGFPKEGEADQKDSREIAGRGTEIVSKRPVGIESRKKGAAADVVAAVAVLNRESFCGP